MKITNQTFDKTTRELKTTQQTLDKIPRIKN